MTKGKLTVLIGLPRSGKSTYSRLWEAGGDMRVVVSSDTVQLATHGHVYLGITTGLCHEIYYIMIRTLLLQGYDVLADDTHSSTSSLLKLFSIQQDLHWFHIDTPEEECIRRAHLTNQSYLEKPIQRLAAQFRKNFPVSVDETMNRLKQEYIQMDGKYRGHIS